MTSSLISPSNHLIEQLPQTDRQRVLGACELVRLEPPERLCEPGAATHHVYFPIEGSISLMTRLPSHAGLQVGMVGQEGMVGVQLVLGVVAAPLLASVESPGRAWRMGAESFAQQMAHGFALRAVLMRYLYVLMGQLAESASCLRFHLIGPRLARWLLMRQDRERSDSFYVTQESLAQALGVRRVGVTRAAGLMQQGGLITYTRGRLCVTNRQGLERAACSCYAADQKNYAELLKPA